MREIERIEQRGKHDCGSACLAMVLEVSIDYVEQCILKRRPGDLFDRQLADECGEGHVGITLYEMQAALWDHGIPHLALCVPAPEERDSWYDRVGNDLPILCPLERTIRHLDNGGVAIIGTKSLNTKGGDHWIAAQGRKLFDPTQKPRRYLRLGDENANPLPIAEAVLVDLEPMS